MMTEIRNTGDSKIVLHEQADGSLCLDVWNEGKGIQPLWLSREEAIILREALTKSRTVEVPSSKGLPAQELRHPRPDILSEDVIEDREV
jgi:hypothetical protein